MDSEDQMIDTLSTTIDAFFREVDPENFETEDLAYSLLRAMRRDGHVS
ncbi:hypothetical protein [Streptomyces nitrosporeus]|nr:hypothetical protein [Streptomyces nitrosporeus]GGY89009.1 hypothetical protein GCM10010327_19710 [Streptomyces nitrosporeus]